ncbi:hypothetical protein [Pseudaestuariivita sp.]|uniref:hypothetical protein n=1 Tax=Pseudaestuariivita sp. TaxID=2211669 RepID=UPI00405A3F4D
MLTAAHWFGAGLALGLLFLWCLVSVIEAGAGSAGWTWGLVVFGLGALVALLMAAARHWSGGPAARTDPLLRGTSGDAVRAGAGQALRSAGDMPIGEGGVPRHVAGRRIG